MESKNRSYAGLGVTKTPTKVTQYPTEEFVEVVEVQNGNVKGNFKDPNNFSFSITKLKDGNFYNRIDGYFGGQPDYLEQSSGQVVGPSATLPFCSPDFARTHDSALSKVYDQIRGNSNLAVDFAEGGQTIRMLRNLTNMRGLMREFLKVTTRSKDYRRLSKGQQRLDYLTGKWLEYRYGWMPLVHSTYDALDNLSKRLSGGLVVVNGRASGEAYKKTKAGSGSYSTPEIIFDSKMKFRTELVLQFRLPQGQQIYDWTSLNPAGIAWELVPLSFVADWFVNVGEVLSLWENTTLFANKFVRGYRTQGYREDTVYTLKGSSRSAVMYNPVGYPYDQNYSWKKSHSCVQVRLHKSRVVLTQLPAPMSGFRFQPKLNAKRLLDAASLLHVFTRKR